MSLPKPLVSALITPGETTGRVVLYGPKGGRSKGRIAPRNRAITPGAIGADGTVHVPTKDPYPPTGAIVQCCVSMPESEFAAMDSLAARLNLQRSTLVRRALRAYAEANR